MYKLWKLLFGKPSVASIAISMPKEFSVYADKAIQLIASSHGQLEDKQLADLFVANSIPLEEATELLLFLLTAFCRHMIPQIKWPAYYIEQEASGTSIALHYTNNSRYVAIEAALMRYLASDFVQQDYLKIAGRNASFKAINQLLLNGSQLENLFISPEVIVR